MASLSTLPAPVRTLLDLSHRDRDAARAVLASLDLEQQVAMVCRAPAAQRARLIDLVPDASVLIPRLPEAELCWTIKAVGLADAAWLLEHATSEQVVACVDLDAWQGLVPDRIALSVWLKVLAEAGDETLLRGARALDPESIVLVLRHRVDVWLKSNDDSWEPPAGGLTLDGQFYYRARGAADDLAEITTLLRVLFQEEYWTYFRFLHAVNWENDDENEEWALRWRTGRLLDLGFPPWEEAMAIYANLPSRALAELPEKDQFIDLGEWPLPIFMPELPVLASGIPSLFRAMAELAPEERRAYLYAFISLANQVAVAERLPLGDAESLTTAFERGAELASTGLDYIAQQTGVDPVSVLRRLSLGRLFRVGVNLTGHRPPPLETDAEPEETNEDDDDANDG